VKAVILHWTAAPRQRAINTWGFFENRKLGKTGYGSAHYIIDLDGAILRCVPDNEVAWHVGSSAKDPASEKIYTDWAREKFGRYAENPKTTSPNFCTLGIEMCCLDNDGNFTPETVQAAKELCYKLLIDFGLGIGSIGTYHLVVGWKDCPRLWTRKPELFEEFKRGVSQLGGKHPLG
jgi:N-acetylmuramoyl-L-alanine amidase